MSNYRILPIAAGAVIVLALLYGWRSLPTFAQVTSIFPAAERTPPNEPSPESEVSQPDKQPTSHCLDGSPLAVTSRDENQTNYKCGSGAIGAYTN